jgi:homoserine dehydrogenase
MMQQVNIGLVGAGTVGGALYKALTERADLLAARLGVRLAITRIAVRDLGKARAAGYPNALLTNDWKAVVHDPDIHLVVELMGGTTTAREVVLAALGHGKPVVTANKALLSAHGEELFAVARANRANLYYEASVAGGIPIIKVIRESLVGNRIQSIRGIVNGTCNYILTRMKLEGADFPDVLADAQRLGYAEADPTLDVDGHDAAHKIGILASLAHGFWVRPEQVHVEGIRHITRLDIQSAAQLGYTIKLLGVVKSAKASAPKAASASSRRRSASQPGILVAVYPALVRNDHVLASVNHAFNAIAVRGDMVGETLFYGRGAGGEPTASSVLSDLADAALDLRHDSHERVPPFVAHASGAIRVVPIDDVTSRYYVRLSVVDRPGVFARIAAVLAKARIGISSIIQPEGHGGATVPVILMLHDASHTALSKAISQIKRLSAVRDTPTVIRVENTDD